MVPINRKKNEFHEKSELLKGKSIILGVTGSIAAVEDVKLIHELKRHGANIRVVMTPAAQKIIHPYSLEYASGNEVITEITGKIEHVTYVNESDLILIAPATADTISKIAVGIDDTPVTTFVSNSLGRKPIILVPAMHEGMMINPVLRENIEKLRKLGVEFLDPIIEENKAKMARIDYIVSSVIRKLNAKCESKKIAVVGGSSVEFIDDVRVITNLSSGETTVAILQAVFYYGGDIDAYLGFMRTEVPDYIKFRSFRTVDELISMIPFIVKNDMVIVPAALSDFTSTHIPGKIPSDNPLRISLKPTKKFLKVLRENYSGPIIGFKAESGIDENELINRARKRLEEYQLNYIIANRLEEVHHKNTTVYLIDKNKAEKYSGEKNDVFIKIIRKLCESLFSR